MPVARKTAGRKTAKAAKPATKTATKRPARKVAKTTTKATAAETNGRTSKFKEIDVPAIVKRLKAGETMTVIRSEYGAGPKIRRALMEAGYNTKGEKIEVAEISGSGAALAKRIAKQREQGVAWYALELATGKSETALKQLLVDHGFEDLAEGRVKVTENEKSVATAKGARKSSRAAKQTTTKPAAKRTAPAKSAVKTKTTSAKPATKAKRGARRVSRRPSSVA